MPFFNTIRAFLSHIYIIDLFFLSKEQLVLQCGNEKQCAYDISYLTNKILSNFEESSSNELKLFTLYYIKNHTIICTQLKIYLLYMQQVSFKAYKMMNFIFVLSLLDAKKEIVFGSKFSLEFCIKKQIY